MSALQFVFILGAAITLLSAIMVVTRRNLIHSALFLVVSLLGVAILFVLLEASFMAVVQIVVYIGAIAILIIMAVMVTREVTGEGVKVFNKNVILAALLAVLVCASLVMALNQWPAFSELAPDVDTSGHVVQIGEELAGKYVVAFEVASVLLLAALIGAIVIAIPKKKEEE